MMLDSILIVDDEQHIIDLAKLYLEKEGFKTTSATNGVTALQRILSERPGLVVLDLMLPEMDGWEVCRRVRAESDVPIIMLTARSDDIDRIVGLELGADDYLTKPFNPRELVARVKAILRRTEKRAAPSDAPADRVITLDNLSIYPERRLVTVDGVPVALRVKEFDLLHTLADNKGMVFTREKLLDVVWGYDFAGETRTVDVHVAHLRHKLKAMRPVIDTVWGVGYRLDA
ncbi:MAG: response regulator transcription factor [bacterium]|nr:response regulator transcription factor [bacterium]